MKLGGPRHLSRLIDELLTRLQSAASKCCRFFVALNK